MADFRKAKVVLTAVYKNGLVLKENHDVPARVSVVPIPTITNYQELNIRMVVDSKDSEELLEGLCRGAVSLNIEQMLSIAEREPNS